MRVDGLDEKYRVLFSGFCRYHRARCFMVENTNPRLSNSFVRGYFTKLGFRMLGSNDIDSEIWTLPLKTTYSL